MKVQQYRLTQGKKIMTTWLEANRAWVGNEVTLKGEEGRWKVVEVFKTAIDSKNLKRGWDNNI